MIIDVVIFLPAITALVLLCVRREAVNALKGIALAGAAITFILSLGFIAGGFGSSFEQVVPWISGAWTAAYHLYVGGIGVYFVLLTTLVGVAVIWGAFSYDNPGRLRGYLALLLGPTVVIEEGSLSQSLGSWGGLLRRHLVRVVFYETLAAAVAFVLSVPFVVPVVLAAGPALGDNVVAQATGYAVAVLLGLAVAPALAYLTVANVFIYLNLRYEQPAPH